MPERQDNTIYYEGSMRRRRKRRRRRKIHEKRALDEGS
jgi:hypothetical protein